MCLSVFSSISLELTHTHTQNTFFWSERPCCSSVVITNLLLWIGLSQTIFGLQFCPFSSFQQIPRAPCTVRSPFKRSVKNGRNYIFLKSEPEYYCLKPDIFKPILSKHCNIFYHIYGIRYFQKKRKKQSWVQQMTEENEKKRRMCWIQGW